jgi:hypothetical protein
MINNYKKYKVIVLFTGTTLRKKLSKHKERRLSNIRKEILSLHKKQEALFIKNEDKKWKR